MLATFLALLCVFLAAVALGANNASNIFGGPVKAGIVPFFGAVILSFLFETAGAFFFGDEVELKFREGIGGASVMGMDGVLAVFLVVAVIVLFASYLNVPVSFKQVLVGAMIGWGFSRSGVADMGEVYPVFSSWVLSPVIGIFGGFVLYRIVQGRVSKGFRGIGDVDVSYRMFAMLEVLSAVALAFAQGANTISAISGVFLRAGVESAGGWVYFPLALRVLCGAGIALGVLLFGMRMISAIFGRVFDANPIACFSVQTVTFIVVVAFTFIGMPVSSMHVLVGALAGAAIVSGVRGVRWGSLSEIALSWVVVVPVAFFVSYAVVPLVAGAF